jgi:SAM-dependent methyltransferase
MVDVDQEALDYAQELLVNRPEAIWANAKGNQFDFLNTNVADLARHSSQNDLNYNTIISSLAMQWVGQDLPDEEAKQMRRDACQSIYDSLNPGGNFINITEEPPNITATTPITFFQSGGKDLKFDLGYNNGCPEEEIHQYCLDAGFKPGVKDYYLMGATDDLGALHDAGLELDELDKKLNEDKKLSADEEQRYLHSYWIVRNAHIGTTLEYIKPE